MFIRTRLVIFAVIACWPAAASQTTRREIAPGIELTQIVVSAGEAGGPRLIHVLTVDPTQRGVRIEADLGGGTVEEGKGGMEAVNRQIARTGAMAGINADFFPFTGDPLGLDIHEGELVSEPFNGRGAVGFTRRGQVVIGRPEFRGSISKEDGTTLLLNGVNRKPVDGETVLFAPVYGEKTPSAAATVAVLKVSSTALKTGVTLKAKVLALSDETGALQIPSRALILTATGAGAAWLKAHAVAGQTLFIKTDVVEEGRDWSNVREAVGGGPVILRNGKEDIQLDREKMGKDFSSTRHPRSAVGVTKDGKVLIVAVDGRQALSRGMSLPELATTMAGLGAVDAVNLDGGGSTALCVRGLVINCPSDGKVRSVANALLVFSGASKLAPVEDPTASPIKEDVLASDGTPVSVELIGGGEHLYGTVNGGAFVSQSGLVYGYKPGTAMVQARAADGKLAMSRSFKVLPGKAGKMLLAWADGTLRITIRDVNNNPVQGQEIGVTRQDGTKTEVTTGADGRAAMPVGWLKDEREPVTLLSGVLTKTWPEAAS